MSREQINTVFEKLSVVAGGDRSAVWRAIAQLTEELGRTPKLSEVIDRITAAAPEAQGQPVGAGTATAADG